MKLAIMQPYFLPYIGYFQLIHAVDKFVIYDNIQFTKKGWINRNRILVNGRDEFITLPLKNDSDYLDIDKRKLADSFDIEKQKILRKIKETYRRAPQFRNVYPFFEELVNYDNVNLFEFVYNSVTKVCTYLNIHTEFIISSSVGIEHTLKSEHRVLALASKLEAKAYINPIGGLELYSKENFKAHHIELKFLQSDPISYSQFSNEFVPWLSILDVMMFNSKEEIKVMLDSYTFR